jgi:hypothetical protein
MIGPYVLKYMELTVKQVQQNLKVAQDSKKSNVDAKRTRRELNIGYHVYIRVKPKNSSLRLGRYTNLAPRYCGPFEILARIRTVDYQLALPATVKVHDVFHVSLLKTYIHDPTHIVDWKMIQVEPVGEFPVETDHILDKRELTL